MRGAGHSVCFAYWAGAIFPRGDVGMIQESVDEAVEVITTYGLDVIGGIIILVVGWIAAGWISRATRNALDRTDPTEAFKEALDATEISIPFPQRDARLFDAKAA